MNIDETLARQTTRVSGGVDREAMYDELTEMFINYQQRLDEPMPPIGEGIHTMLYKYRTDQIFRGRVRSLVVNVMCVVNKHIN